LTYSHDTVFRIHVRTVFVDTVHPFLGLPLVWYGWIEMCVIEAVSRICQLALSLVLYRVVKSRIKEFIFCLLFQTIYAVITASFNVNSSKCLVLLHSMQTTAAEVLV